MYVEEYGWGGFLKGLGSIAAGTLGAAFGGPVGAALASGIFTGLTEKDLKKGILSGLTAYVGGKALGDLGKAADAAGASKVVGGGVTGPGGVAMPAVTQASRLADASPWQQLSGGFRQLGARGGLESLGQSLTSPGNVALVYPQMGTVARQIQLEREQEEGGGMVDPYWAELQESRRKFRNRYGARPFSSLYGYRNGSIVKPYARGGLTFDPRVIVRRDDEGIDLRGVTIGGGGGTGSEPYVPGIDPGDIGWNDPFMGGDPTQPETPAGDDPDPDTGLDEPGDGTTAGPGDETPNTPDTPVNDDPDPETGQGEPPPVGDPPIDRDPDEPPEDPYEIPTPNPRNTFTRPIPAGFTPGFMPEFNYFMDTADPRGGDPWSLPEFEPVGINPFDMASLDALLSQTPDMLSSIGERFASGQRRGGMIEPMADGGEVDSVVDQDLINAAVSALTGQVPPQQAEQILQQFVAKYGEEGLEELKRMVLAEQESMPKTEGMLGGDSGGMDDMIPASVTGANPVALSSGEYIVPADVVSMIGDGNSKAGAKRLDGMTKNVRKQKTGSTEQAPPMDSGILSLM